MRFYLPLLLLILLIGTGCQSPVPIPIETIPIEQPKPTEQPSSIVPTIPVIPTIPPIIPTVPYVPILIVETVVYPQIYINYAKVINITENSGLLEFETNQECTAKIKLQAGEIEIAQYSIDTKNDSHSMALSNLKYSTNYIVIIEVVGVESNDKKVIQFTTLTPLIQIREISGSPIIYGGWYTAPCNGGIVATWHHGDGSFNGNVWTVQVKPGEIKHCYFLVNNQTPQSTIILVQALANVNIVISGNELIIPACSEGLYEVTMTVKGFAPIGTYSIDLALNVP